MQLVEGRVQLNQLIASKTYRMQLVTEAKVVSKPGQFLSLTIPGFYLPRPFSVSYAKPGLEEIIYRVVGRGTEALSKCKVGERLQVLQGLGTGFTLPQSGSSDLLLQEQKPLLVGGGVGAAPLYLLAIRLIELGLTPKVILGFKTKAEVILQQEFTKLSLTPLIVTEDGSLGEMGLVTDSYRRIVATLEQRITVTSGQLQPYLYTCGPEPMMRSLYRAADLPAQYSLEQHMACSLGACMGCTVDTTRGRLRVCKEGPVFYREDLNWALSEKIPVKL